VSDPNALNSGIGNSQVTNELVVERITSGLPVRTNLESWVVWSSVPITQVETNVNEGEVALADEIPAASGGRAGVGIAGGMRIK
jgi:hypothetical protein